MQVNPHEQLAAAAASKQAAMVEFMHLALHGQGEQAKKVTAQAVEALDTGAGPTTADLVNLVIAAARGANIADQAMATLGRLAMQHADYFAGF